MEFFEGFSRDPSPPWERERRGTVGREAEREGKTGTEREKTAVNSVPRYPREQKEGSRRIDYPGGPPAGAAG